MVGGERSGSWGGYFFLPGLPGFEAPIRGPVFFWFFLVDGAQAPFHPEASGAQQFWAGISPLDRPGQWHLGQVKKSAT